MKRKIDHIVYSVPDLKEACDHIENTLGIRPQIGGYHKTKGTMNALLNLGNTCYLEILAVDESNSDISGPRWMGVDLIDEPRVTRWSLKSSQLIEDQQHLRQYSELMGQISGGTRQTPAGDTLQWNMILPLASPAIEIIPFMTDWARSSIHPTNRLEQECQLIDIEFRHPLPELIQPVFTNLDIQEEVKKDSEAAISFTVKYAEKSITLR